MPIKDAVRVYSAVISDLNASPVGCKDCTAMDAGLFSKGNSPAMHNVGTGQRMYPGAMPYFKIPLETDETSYNCV
jgi:hypothetical protein